VSDQPAPFEALLSVVVEDARAAARRERDRDANRAREAVLAAEEDVAALERAARELGEARGAAAKEAIEREADAEIKNVLAGSFDRLYERFELRVTTALNDLRESGRYAETLETWSRTAAAAMDRPSDAFAAPEDRDVVYDALLAAGATDFQVHVDRSIRLGFVVRDMDGKTILDRRPEEIVRQMRGELRNLLRERVPAPPGVGREGGAD
jgi:vacuolar-type H+-ATPase subunit E/Vma4